MELTSLAVQDGTKILDKSTSLNSEAARKWKTRTHTHDIDKYGFAVHWFNLFKAMWR